MRSALIAGLLGAGLVGVVLAASAAAAAPLRIVAAESVYGDVARQIAGAAVAVTSILGSPTQDPHAYEASPATARQIADADLVIYNGAGYDPWAARLLQGSRSAAREVLPVAQLMHKRPGDDPHLWYDPAAVLALAQALAEALARLDAAHGDGYRQRLEQFRRSMKPLLDQVAALRGAYAGQAVTATEPVFGYMAQALGLNMRNGRFQLAVMNGTEPSATAIAGMEKDLRTHAVRVLIYNSQTTEALAQRMRAIALDSGVPVLDITETLPAGKTYQEWMLAELSALERALAR
ncbi:MAG: metal ABC transporter solute-binding protein, Zn/Mn family [SAR324 cluster bacterium]